MTSIQITKTAGQGAQYLAVRGEAEEFLYDEVELLDNRDFTAWLDMLEDDLKYFMPITFNARFGEHDLLERTKVEKDMSWFNEGKCDLFP